MVDVVTAALLPLAAQIDSACLFGSVAQGQENSYSDVDVLLIGSIGFADVAKALFPCQETLGREVNQQVFDKAQWAEMMRKNSGFAQGIAAKPKMFLIGGVKGLKKLVGISLQEITPDPVIPVSCVESGRWHHTWDDFTSALRALKSWGRWC